MTFLPRRVISLVLALCFAGMPSLLLACAVTCLPGLMTHGVMAAAASDAASAAEGASHEHLHHAMPAGQPSAQPPSDAAGALVAGMNLASSIDIVGPDCCAHTRASATTSTPANRPDTAALLGSVTSAGFITVALRDVRHVRATLLVQSLPSLPPRSSLVLRI